MIDWMNASLRYVSEKTFTAYSPELGYVSPCHVMDWKRGGGRLEVERAVNPEVRTVVGMRVVSGRPKKEGSGRGRVVVKRVTWRRTYFW
jgi:hypothetical protein